MLRVEVKNFQSIAEETVEISGFSVVVGRSNIGKSALVRAVKAALTGAPAENYVRHAIDCQRIVKGAKTCKCFCSVRIAGPGFDLLWEKGDAVNRYLFNGTEHTVVGRGTPEFLGPEFAPVYIGGDSTPTLLQVADQFRPLFILDRSGTAVADVLSDVAKLDQINDAARAADKDKRECASARKLRDKDLKALDSTLEGYDGLDVVVARVKAVEAMEAAVDRLEARSESLDRFTLALTQCTASLRALQPIAKLEIPSMAEVVERAGQFQALSRWQSLLRVNREASNRLEEVGALQVPEVSTLAKQDFALRSLAKWAGQLAAIKVVFGGLKAAEAILVPELSSLMAAHTKFRTLSSVADRFCTLEAQVLKLQQALATAEHDEASVLREFKALEVCPTCRQPVSAIGHTHLGAA